MAENVAFRALLENRLNLTAATVDAIEGQGITTLTELAELDYDDIKGMVMNIMKFIAPHAPGNDIIRIPFVAQKKLYAAKFWHDLQLRIGGLTTAGSLTNAAITAALSRRKDVEERKAAMKDQELTKPPKLTSFKDWVNWWELWDTYMQQTYGMADIPLSYVYREHEIATPEMRTAAYPEDDDLYIAITELRGRHYQLDNRRVWNELKPLVVDGPGWVFIKTLEDTKNGRNAIITLKRQNEGENSTMIRKQKAYTALKNLAFTGPRKHWTFSQYVTGHQKAHNELEACHEPVPETKKVTDFLGGITDPSLGAGLANVYGDIQKLQSFETCQQYLCTIVASTNVHKRNLNAARSVAGTETEASAGRKKPRLEAKNYPLEQWKMFSPAEQKKINLLRQQKKKAAKKTGGKPPERNASVTEQQLQLPPLAAGNGTPPAGSPPAGLVPNAGNKGGTAGNQFGRAAHGSGNDNRQ
jgi:hypothetical protein